MSAQEAERRTINPELRSLNIREDEIRSSMQSVLQDESGDVAERPFNIHFDQNGALDNITLNGVANGKGKLGALLKDQAIGYFGSADPFSKDFKSRYTLGFNDAYLLEAYKTDPRVREVLDQFIPLEKERQEIEKKKSEMAENKKIEYQSGENINVLLGKLGIEKKVPNNFELSRTLEFISKADPKNISEIKAYATLVTRLAAPFEALGAVPKDVLDEASMDLDGVKNNLERIYQALMSKTWSQSFSKESLQAIDEILRKAPVTKNFYFGPADRNWLKPSA